MTPQTGDEVSEQTHDNKAEVSVKLFGRTMPIVAEVQSQGFREARRDDRTLSFLLNTGGAQ